MQRREGRERKAEIGPDDRTRKNPRSHSDLDKRAFVARAERSTLRGDGVDGPAWERAVGAASRPLSLSYTPRSPEDTPLHCAVRAHLVTFLEGFSLHAGVHLHAHDRRGLEQLCGHRARGAIALSRLSELDDGRSAYRTKRPLPDGRTHLVLDGVGRFNQLA